MFAEVLSDRGRGTTVVYLPGIDGSGQLLLGTAPRLEERYRLVRMRYRLSANPDHRTYAHLARSAIEAVTLRGVERMVLLAESFGGAVALQRRDRLSGAGRSARAGQHLRPLSPAQPAWR